MMNNCKEAFMNDFFNLSTGSDAFTFIVAIIVFIAALVAIYVGTDSNNHKNHRRKNRRCRIRIDKYGRIFDPSDE